ncbi:STAS domain-containing protein [Gordonia lacunae]|uniref:STAS domain-containing protein n=1 Tax=Gordonia lacunae TaxID=417102 RepID=A0A243QE91_9ACTN|nr:STAS domain-containing protein [Gordonia lacunae]OUC80000.1 hypothetical protein CA982_04665 [Gordonia lacunae]
MDESMGQYSDTSHPTGVGARPAGTGTSRTTAHISTAHTTTTSSCVQRFSGDVDLNTVADFDAALTRTVARHNATVIFDLTGVDFLGACGLETLARVCTDATRAGVRVVLVCEPALARLVRMCDIPVAIRSSIDEAYGIGDPQAR